MEDNNLKFDYKAIKKRWRDSLTGGNSICPDKTVQKRLMNLEIEARKLWETMIRDEGRTCIWEDLSDPNNIYQRDWVCKSTFDRIEKLVLAYSTKGNPFFGHTQLLKDILSAMEFIDQNWYNEKTRKNGEWWHKEIGLPLKVNNCFVLLDKAIPEKLWNNYMRTVESFTSAPRLMCLDKDIPETSTGANRVWKCYALAGCGVLTEDREKLAVSARDIKDVFQFTESGDGFYKDGSFVQHFKFAYTGGYGRSFLTVLADYMDLLWNTEWQLKEQELAMVSEWIDNAFTPFIYKGGFANMVMGREIAREYAQEHVTGHQIIYAMIKLAGSLPKKQADLLLSKIKYWITSDTYYNYYENAPLSLIGRTRSIVDNPNIIPWEETAECRVFAGMDRVLHRRRNYTFGISMNSERIGKYESIHDENVRGWYTSEGTTYLYNADLAQYSEGYFPTVNAYRMPGTTVDTLIRPENGFEYGQEPPIHHSWAGGCQLNNLYGVAGMDLEAYDSDLTAKKSWFLFDEEIVCLGAGITCTGDRPIETIVENRKVSKRANQKVDVNSTFVEQLDLKEKGKVMLLKGAVEDSEIGYYFPTGCVTEIMEEVRTDCWKSIHDPKSNKYENSDNKEEFKISNRYATIIIPHGIQPREEEYQYVILPGKKMEQLCTYGKDPQIEVLENSKRVQAVRQKELGIIAANFWTEDAKSIAGITCHGQASVVMQSHKNGISLAVSDPTWHRKEPLLLEIDHGAADVISADKEITVLKLMPKIQILVDTQHGHGKSFQITLKNSPTC